MPSRAFHCYQRRGFTLIELFTVTGMLIALTLLLLCLPPPYYRTGSGRQSSCMSNIKALIQGLKMYRDDHSVCPEALYGISRDGVNL